MYYQYWRKLTRYAGALNTETPIETAVFSHDGKLAATGFDLHGGKPGTTQIWDVSTDVMHEIGRLENSGYHPKFSPNKRYVLLLSHSKEKTSRWHAIPLDTINIWDIAQKKIVAKKILPGHILGADFVLSAPNDLDVLFYTEEYVYRWNFNANKRLAIAETPDQALFEHPVHFIPEQKKIAITSMTTEVYDIWGNWLNGYNIDQSESPFPVVAKPDGNVLLYSHKKYIFDQGIIKTDALYLFNVEENGIHTINQNFNESVRRMDFDVAKNILVTLGENNETIKSWHLNPFSPIQKLPQSDSIIKIDLVPNQNLCMIVYRKGVIKWWNYLTGQIFNEITFASGPARNHVHSVNQTLDGKKVLTVVVEEKKADLWSLPTAILDKLTIEDLIVLLKIMQSKKVILNDDFFEERYAILLSKLSEKENELVQQVVNEGIEKGSGNLP